MKPTEPSIWIPGMATVRIPGIASDGERSLSTTLCVPLRRDPAFQVSGYLHQAMRGRKNDGLAQRFQLLVYPDLSRTQDIGASIVELACVSVCRRTSFRHGGSPEWSVAELSINMNSFYFTAKHPTVVLVSRRITAIPSCSREQFVSHLDV